MSTHPILNQLNGKPTKPFDQALEDSIKKMFVQIQAPLSSLRQAQASSLLQLCLLHKFCELLWTATSSLDRFLINQGQAGTSGHHNITRRLNWEFIPGILSEMVGLMQIWLGAQGESGDSLLR
jgi:hypothetical protein